MHIAPGTRIGQEHTMNDAFSSASNHTSPVVENPNGAGSFRAVGNSGGRPGYVNQSGIPSMRAPDVSLTKHVYLRDMQLDDPRSRSRYEALSERITQAGLGREEAELVRRAVDLSLKECPENAGYRETVAARAAIAAVVETRSQGMMYSARKSAVDCATQAEITGRGWDYQASDRQAWGTPPMGGSAGPAKPGVISSFFALFQA